MNKKLPEEMDIPGTLRKAIEHNDVATVQKCLQQGADPNHLTDFSEFETDNTGQPTTPLSLVVFCISNSFLKDEDLKQFAEITKLLLKHGADPKPAMELAELRYGKYDPDLKGLFMDVLHLIAKELRS